MAILETIPKKSPITDYRNDEGGYHVASCEICGTIYYPKRYDSKYCSHNCIVAAQRKRKIDSGVKAIRYDKKDIKGYAKRNKLTKIGTFTLASINKQIKEYDVFIAKDEIPIGEFRSYDNKEIVVFNKSGDKYILYYYVKE